MVILLAKMEKSEDSENERRMMKKKAQTLNQK
jgi:hypothetical protein